MLSKILCRARTRKFVLQKLRSMRPDLTRVSSNLLDQYETLLRDIIMEDVNNHSSRGKTFNESAFMQWRVMRRKQ